MDLNKAEQIFKKELISLGKKNGWDKDFVDWFMKNHYNVVYKRKDKLDFADSIVNPNDWGISSPEYIGFFKNEMQKWKKSKKSSLLRMQKIAEFLKGSSQSTRESLNDAKRTFELGYKCVGATLDFKDTTDVILKVFFKKGKQAFSQEFTGFSAGYSGEGPRGLAEFCKMFKIKGWDFNKISNLKPGKYVLK